ncbi:hypothetical protein GCM10020367_53980 [Streptomyces sannanensis]|uniref:Uncharacterized protein n=1 Tax=Streptomyces sannanensis TaxID=285536 RepID=A0ABP6SIA5_9ACTN
MVSGDWIASRISFTVASGLGHPLLEPRAWGSVALRKTLEGNVGAAVEVCRRSDGVVLWQRLLAREVACDAGVRAHKPRLAGTAGARGGSLHAGRPDNINV